MPRFRLDKFNNNKLRLTEAKQIGLIAHNTRGSLSDSLSTACEIISSNTLNGNFAWGNIDDYKEIPYVCFTKNLHLVDQDSRYHVSIVLDGNRMSDKYKFIELNESTDTFSRFKDLNMVCLIPSCVYISDSDKQDADINMKDINDLSQDQINKLQSWTGKFKIFIGQLRAIYISNSLGMYLMQRCKQLIPTMKSQLANMSTEGIKDIEYNQSGKPTRETTYYTIFNEKLNIYSNVVNGELAATASKQDGILLSTIFDCDNENKFKDAKKNNRFLVELCKCINEKMQEVRIIGGSHSSSLSKTSKIFKVENVRDYIVRVCVSKLDYYEHLENFSTTPGVSVQNMPQSGINYVILTQLCNKYNIPIFCGTNQIFYVDDGRKALVDRNPIEQDASKIFSGHGQTATDKFYKFVEYKKLNKGFYINYKQLDDIESSLLLSLDSTKIQDLNYQLYKSIMTAINDIMKSFEIGKSYSKYDVLDLVNSNVSRLRIQFRDDDSRQLIDQYKNNAIDQLSTIVPDSFTVEEPNLNRVPQLFDNSNYSSYWTSDLVKNNIGIYNNENNLFFTSDLHFNDEDDRIIQRFFGDDNTSESGLYSTDIIKNKLGKDYYDQYVKTHSRRNINIIANNNKPTLHDDIMIKNITSKAVGCTQPVLFILGDIWPHKKPSVNSNKSTRKYIVSKIGQLLDVFSKICFMCGNHETDSHIVTKQLIKDLEKTYGSRFIVIDDPSIFNYRDTYGNNILFVLSHQPVRSNQYSLQDYKGSVIVNLCGHLHSDKVCVNDIASDKMSDLLVKNYNVAPEAHEMSAVSFKEILDDIDLANDSEFNRIYNSKVDKQNFINSMRK